MNHHEAIIQKEILYGHAISTKCSNYNFHFHEHFEIYLFISGDVTMFVNDRSYKPVRGDLFVFNSTDIHKSLNHTDTAYERYCIHFLPDVVSQYSTELTNLLSCFYHESTNIVHLSDTEISSISKKINKMIALQNQPGYGSDVLTKSTLVDLLVNINLAFQNAKNVPEQIQNTVVSNLILYINEHIQDELSLDILAKKFSIDKNYFCRIFKQVTGSTIWQYLVVKRIALAKQLLLKGHTVQDVCMSCGFNNYAHFSRTFKSLVGMTAREYQHTYSSEASDNIN